MKFKIFIFCCVIYWVAAPHIAKLYEKHKTEKQYQSSIRELNEEWAALNPSEPQTDWIEFYHDETDGQIRIYSSDIEPEPTLYVYQE